MYRRNSNVYCLPLYFLDRSTHWLYRWYCECCLKWPEVINQRWRPLNRKYSVQWNCGQCIVDIPMASSNFPRSFNSLDISSTYQLVVSAVGSNRMWKTKDGPINGLCTYISACEHDSNEIPKDTSPFSRSSNTLKLVWVYSSTLEWRVNHYRKYVYHSL